MGHMARIAFFRLKLKSGDACGMNTDRFPSPKNNP